jgi:YVTN family beta-propeller protein
MTSSPWSKFSFAFAGLALISAAMAAPPKFAVIHRFPISGDEGWDYLTVDSASHRLFVSRGSRVAVLDVDSGKQIGEIPNQQGVHGVAIDIKLGKGYISNGRGNSVTVFDLKSYAVLKSIPTGQNPDAIIYDAKTRRILTMNGRSNDVTVIDPATDGVVGTIKVGGKPEFAAGDGAGHVFLNNEDESKVEEIDVLGLKNVGAYSIAPGDGPSGLAFDSRGHRIFSVCGNQLMTILDSKSGKLIGTVKIGNGPDAAAYDPKLDLAFSSNGQDGTVTVVGKTASGFGPIQEVETMRSARTMALDPRTHCLYLIAAEFSAPAAGERRGRMKPGSAVILVVGPVQ